MSKACVFFADGLEECEALIVVDVLRRAGVEVTTASISGSRAVRSTHGVGLEADVLAAELNGADFDLLVLPGGQPGTTHLGESPVVARMVTAAASQGKKVAAICAAPTVLAKLGLLNGREAVCYPSCRENLAGAVQSAQPVVVSGRFITGEALGSAIPFALELAAQLTGRANAEAVAKAICYNW